MQINNCLSDGTSTTTTRSPRCHQPRSGPAPRTFCSIRPVGPYDAWRNNCNISRCSLKLETTPAHPLYHQYWPLPPRPRPRPNLSRSPQFPWKTRTPITTRITTRMWTIITKTPSDAEWTTPERAVIVNEQQCQFSAGSPSINAIDLICAELCAPVTRFGCRVPACSGS